MASSLPASLGDVFWLSFSKPETAITFLYFLTFPQAIDLPQKSKSDHFLLFLSFFSDEPTVLFLKPKTHFFFLFVKKPSIPTIKSACYSSNSLSSCVLLHITKAYFPPCNLFQTVHILGAGILPEAWPEDPFLIPFSFAFPSWHYNTTFIIEFICIIYAGRGGGL